TPRRSTGRGRRNLERVECHSTLRAETFMAAHVPPRNRSNRMAPRLHSLGASLVFPAQALPRKAIRMNDAALPATADAAPQRRWLIPLALLAVYVIWGSTYLGIRIGLTGFPPFALAAIRFFAAGIAMYAWLRLRGVKPPTRRQWRNAAITGVLLLLFGNGLVCFAEQSVTSGIAAVAIASEPLFVAMVLFAYRDRPSRNEIVGLVVGFLGVIVLNSGGAMRAAPWAAVALLVATAAWAFGSMWSRRQDMPEGPMNVAAQMLCAAPALALAAWLTGERWPAHPSMTSIIAVAYLAVFG